MSEGGRHLCEHCGTEVRQTANFCPNCGAAQRPDPEQPTGSEKSVGGNPPPGTMALATYCSSGVVTGKPTRVWIYNSHIEFSQFVDPIRRNMQRARYDQIAQVYTKKGLIFAELIIETRGGGTLRVPGLSKDSADEAASLILERM